MHSRKKGKSGSTKVYNQEVSVRYEAKEIEMLVAKYAKAGNTAAQIGLILRDSYGIPSVKAILKKSIGDILKEKKLTKKIPEDLQALIKKRIAAAKHYKSNKQDQTAKRGIKLTDSKILRLIKYYKTQGIFEQDFRFNFDKAELYLE